MSASGFTTYARAARALADAELIERLTREVLELRRRQVPTIRRAPTTIGHGKWTPAERAMRRMLRGINSNTRTVDETLMDVMDVLDAMTRRIKALEREASVNGLGERG